MQYSGSERRRHSRMAKPFTARMHHLTAKPAPYWDIVTLQDISAGGMRFRYENTIEAGTVLDFKINFPMTDRPIEAMGKVVRTRPLGSSSFSDVSVCFTAMRPEEQAFIDDFIEKHLSSSA